MSEPNMNSSESGLINEGGMGSDARADVIAVLLVISTLVAGAVLWVAGA